MLSYQDIQNQLHTRLVDFTLQEYLFVLQVVYGERKEVAYAMVYDQPEFKRNVPGEDEEDYLKGYRHAAENLLEQQNCQHLQELIAADYHREVQERASNLEDFKFTGSDVQRILNNLLHDRTQDLTESSIRDIVSLLKMMYESGTLESGDSFQHHFITIPKKYDCICPACGREMYLVEGVDNRCQHCNAVFRWEPKEERFYPQPSKL